MPKCNCKKDKCLSPAVLQINNHDCPTVFHKVTFPAAMGDDETNPPRNGQYRNVLLVYEANEHAYMFSSDGIPTLISDGSQGVDDYNELTNKPSIEGHELAGDSSLEDIGVTDAIEDALEDYSPTSEFAEVAFTGDYDDLIGTPAIPTQTSDLTNDGSDGTSTYVEADELATVATSGSYNDLSNKPTIPAAQVNSDWNANSGVAQILNKPTLAAVATSGDYDDLINKPTPITVDSALSWASQNPVENQTIRKTIYVKNSSNDKEAGINIAFSNPDLSPYVHLGSKTSATKGINSVGIGNNAEASAVRSVAIGNSATASKREGVALGPNATAGQYSLSIGYYTETVPNYSTAVGPYAKVLTGATNATAIGYKSEASEAETVSVGKSTNKRRIVNVADGTTATDAATVGQIPTKTSDLTNDGADNTSTYVEADELATVATSGSYNDLSNTPSIPSYSDFTGATSGVAGASGLVPAPAAGDDTKFLSGDGTWKTVSGGSSYTAGNGISIDANNEISIDGAVVAELSDLPTDFTGATASVAGAHGLVPAPAAGDQGKVLKGDGTWGDKSEKFVIMKYGESNAWAKFIAAYNENAIVYCRASSNANPATGSQTRLAFMAYVSNETNPTNVEFQYVRSVGTKTSSQPVDQVFVYKLESTNGGTWTVQTRDMAPKLAAGTNTTVSYSNGTYTVSATDRPTRTIIYDNGSGTNTDFVTTTAMSSYDDVEICYRDGNNNYALKLIPGPAGSFVLDIAHPGADNTVYWYISRYLVSGTNVTVGANNTRKAIGASSITTTASQDIYITRITGIKY